MAKVQPKVCSVEGCERRYYGSGLCNMHWLRLRRTGDLDRGRPERPSTCIVDGCERAHYGKGYCRMHLRRVTLTGDPGDPRPIREQPKALCAIEGCDRERRRGGWCEGHWRRWKKKGDPGTHPVAPLRGSSFPKGGPCPFCDKVLMSRHTLRAHVMNFHADQCGFECPECHLRFYEERGLNSHRAFKHPDADRPDTQDIQRRNQRYNLRKFGLTPEAYVALVEAQGGGCAVCGVERCGDGRRLHVDHDHTTGRVRGVLCAECNTSLGKMRDDPSLLRRLADYAEGNLLT